MNDLIPEDILDDIIANPTKNLDRATLVALAKQLKDLAYFNIDEKFVRVPISNEASSLRFLFRASMELTGRHANSKGEIALILAERDVRISKLVKAVENSRDVFFNYHEHHLKKNTEDSLAKAARNLEHYELCNEALNYGKACELGDSGCKDI